MKETDIKPYHNNPKKHPPSQLKKLAEIIAEFGWRLPSLVNDEGVLIVGHGRWEMYQEYKDSHNLKPIWIINTRGETVFGAPEKTPLTKAQETAYRIADNKISELGTMDLSIVLEELQPLSQELQMVSGFEDYELASIEDIMSGVSDDLEDVYEEPTLRQLACPNCGHTAAVSEFKNSE